MRLVSAFYDDAGPFGGLSKVDSYAVVDHPRDLKEGDILIIHGGADISPSLYNKNKSKYGHGGVVPSTRDAGEWALMQRAKELGVPIIGICRGAQMLCALEGGYLIQHVDNHSGTHVVHTTTGEELITNSIHHQMMVPVGGTILGWTDQRSFRYYDEDTNLTNHPLGVEPELVQYPSGFAIQWHPEMMAHTHPTNKWLLQLINNHV